MSDQSNPRSEASSFLANVSPHASQPDQHDQPDQCYQHDQPDQCYQHDQPDQCYQSDQLDQPDLYDQPDQPSPPANDPELTERVFIVKRTDDYLNRWRFSEHNDLVSYETERFMQPDTLTTGDHPISRLIAEDYQNLRRIKVYGLSETVPHTKQLLDSLQRFIALDQLEIDQLVLESYWLIEYTFRSLKTLSIDSIKLIDEHGLETETSLSLLWIDAPLLHSVYLGENSIYYLLFGFQDSIRTLVCDEDRSGCIVQFRKLQHLECNRVCYHRFTAILEVAERNDLLTLSCNLDNFASTAVQLDEDQLQLLAQLHDGLSKSNKLKTRIKESTLRIALQGVEVDLVTPFIAYVSEESCKLVESIIAFHHHNFERLFRWNTVTRIDYLQLLVGEETRFLQPDASPVSHFYPNLRSVQVCNWPQLQAVGSKGAGFHQIDPALLFVFLHACSGLTELRLHNTRFDQTVYDQLIELDLIECLRKLSIFEDFEMNPLSEQDVPGYVHYRPIAPLNFRFLLQFRFLRLFRTNLASRLAMFEAVRKMQIGDEFQFRFLDAAGGGSNQLTFVNTVPYWQLKIGYALRLEQFYADDINEPLKTLNRRSLKKLFALLSEERNLHVTRFAWRLPSDQPADAQ